MSALSELRDRVSGLENRVAIMENALVKLLDRPNVQDLSTEMIKVSEEDSDIETRTLIGFKPSK
jgi:hypothetical protein